MVRAAVALGSNLGNRLEHLDAGVDGLRSLGTIVAESPVYETAPVGGPDQDPYLNAVVVVETDLAAPELLKGMLEIERSRGRERVEKWGPRTLDLDLLLYGSETIDLPGLTVPHPRMTQRRFVLDPLLDVWPDAVLPDGTPLESFRAEVAGQAVERLGGESGFRPWTALAVFVIFNIAAVLIWRIILWLG